MKERSFVWDHFTKYADKGQEMCKCNYCGMSYKCIPRVNGTSTYKSHLSKCSKFSAKKYKDPGPKQAQISFQSSLNKDGDLESSLLKWSFNYEKCRRALALMVLVDELPFRFVEAQGFRFFCSQMQSSILDPRYKWGYMEYWISQMYDSPTASILCDRVERELYDLFDEYKVSESKCQSSSASRSDSSTSTFDSETSVHSKGIIRVRYKKLKAEKDEGDMKSELQKYLEEDQEEDVDNFDILKWWSTNSSRFPILSLMARDVLAISVSTVASESAFSTGRRVLDAFRSSLTPRIVEALICGQDWLRASPLPFDVEEKLDEMEKLEADFAKGVLTSTIDVP